MSFPFFTCIARYIVNEKFTKIDTHCSSYYLRSFACAYNMWNADVLILCFSLFHVMYAMTNEHTVATPATALLLVEESLLAALVMALSTLRLYFC